MGGSARQRTRSTTTRTMPAEQQGNYENLMQGIQDLYASGGPQYFPGQNYTTPTANQLAGRQQAVDYAGGVGQNLISEAQRANSFWMDPNNLFNLERIPGYTGVRQGIITDTTRNLTENILPQSRGAAITGGGLGGSRQQMADALAAGRTSESIAQALSGMDLGMYGQNMAANQRAIDRSPTMFSLGLEPANIFNQVGTAERGDEAERINADMARWDFEQNRLPRLLALVQALTGSAGQYGGTDTSKANVSGGGGGGWLQGLGGLMSLGSMFMGGGGGMPAAGGVGTGTSGIPWQTNWGTIGANLARPFY